MEYFLNILLYFIITNIGFQCQHDIVHLNHTVWFNELKNIKIYAKLGTTLTFIVDGFNENYYLDWYKYQGHLKIPIQLENNEKFYIHSEENILNITIRNLTYNDKGKYTTFYSVINQWVIFKLKFRDNELPSINKFHYFQSTSNETIREIECRIFEYQHKEITFHIFDNNSKTLESIHNPDIIIKTQPYENGIIKYILNYPYNESKLITCSTSETNDLSNFKITSVVLGPYPNYFLIIPRYENRNNTPIENNSLVEVPIGIELNLDCFVVSEALGGSIDWFKNGQILNDSSKDYSIKKTLKTISNTKFNIATLKLAPVRRKHKEIYSCVTDIQERKKLLTKTIAVEVSFKDLPSVPVSIIISVTLIGILLVLTLLVIGIRLLRKRSQRALKCTNMNKMIESDLSMQNFIRDLKYDKRYEFPKNKLKLGEYLGSGNFGIIQKAVANGIVKGEKKSLVAVKTVKDSNNVEAFRCFISEMKIMIHLGRHLNIVNLLGAVTKNLSKGELLLIVEYCTYGNLQIFLKNNRNIFVDEIDGVTDLINPSITYNYSSSDNYLIYPNPIENETPVPLPSREKSDDVNKPYKKLTRTDLICWAYQISLGMRYISERNIMHGDLAARNVLLTDGNIVKICDFGLAKDISNQYGKYIKKQDDQLPLKWLAPESLKDLEFTIKSDVWSFGILLWELFALGSNPYPGINAKGLEFLNLLIQGYRMKKPDFANQVVYEIMLKCWETEPLNRPKFSDLVSRLANFLERDICFHYLQMNSILEQDNKEYFSTDDKNGYMVMLPAFNTIEKLYMNAGEQTASYMNL